MLDELHDVNRRLEGAHPAEVMRWAHERFGAGLVVTTSCEDAVLVHLAASVSSDVDVVLIDTQYLFAETQWYAGQLARLGVTLRVVTPAADVVPDDRWQTDVDGCCHVRKVEPLNRALAGKSAWVTGIRRADGPSRANAPIVSWDAGRNLVKVNPLATLSDEDLALYERLYELPRHPLMDRGYASIGCWPCTRPVAPGEDRRGGRWSGTGKVECGLHA
ncbi:MAG: phosphoadenylyl-sulfate reductase [Acidimicrobiales bacterium]